MAKSGGFLAGLVGIFVAAWRQSQKERLRAEQNYRTEIKKATSGSVEQAEYEKLVMSAPLILGNNRFDFRVFTGFADRFALDSFSQYLEIMHDKDADFFALLKHNPDLDSDQGDVIVEAGQAIIGHLYFADETEISDLLLEHPLLRASCKITKLVDGDYQVWLDIETEPEISIAE